eukprot:CAMPEP_0194287846 /NCGR_PEP_ID=MMETSP0169-20130528/35611_1 /TAXON_ID=218684 /ORGANISM="Corethron pennatum, Strain L29A3" /LENGTH=61 /DNA_ID=CAMNT_0039034675 /DNA_START=172 /DNA_END=353 /DNA_ORIENTATION=-
MQRAGPPRACICPTVSLCGRGEGRGPSAVTPPACLQGPARRLRRLRVPAGAGSHAPTEPPP